MLIAFRCRLLLALLLTVPALAEPPLRIGKIIIQPLDVYSSSEAKRGWAYRVADRLHVETHESVIRKFLLFSEGDVYEPSRLAETERNLRTTHFLKSASVVASEPHDGVVDVTVTTQDAWSIAPETQAGSRGGTSTYGISLTEDNLLGFGKEISLSWDKELDRTRTAIDYQDPMLFAGYWNAHFTYGHTSDGSDERATIRRPFYSFATPWATELTVQGFEREDKLYANTEEVDRFRHRARRLVASYGIALDPNDTVANRLIGGIRVTRDDFAFVRGLPTPLPDDRNFHFLFVRGEHATNDFIKLNFVNKDLRYEDFNLGTQTAVELAVSPEALDLQRNTFFARTEASRGLRLGPTSFLMPSVALESRFATGFENAIASGNLLFVRRGGGERPTSTVGRISFNGGWRLDREDQFFADGITGLRGYRVHAFEGSRALILNLEQRFHLGRELLQLASPGVVAFVDAGNATDGGFGQLFRLKVDAGVGIRVGLPRTPKNLIRIDFAYAFMQDPRGRRGFLVSVTSGQAF